ncbi:hypothetical protein T07_760 [Trichinella nelsoni]|uniref:Uncharacterized protein n=1 Tax=Trichinella nelsoni TaxID=6336 RepID=A0A0V0RXX8_9BILA|nr:hypothetical protein T07_760 [Trichinella nelsoni]
MNYAISKVVEFFLYDKVALSILHFRLLMTDILLSVFEVKKSEKNELLLCDPCDKYAREVEEEAYASFETKEKASEKVKSC